MFWEITYQRMKPKPFRKQYHMKMETLAALTSYLDIDIVPQTDASKMVAMTISFLRCATGYQQMSVLFRVTEDTFIRSTERSL